MATHALPSSHILDDDDAPAAPPARTEKPSLMRRLYDAMIEAQTRRAAREVDRMLGRGTFARAMRGELPPER
jgi:hypothetical protein